MARIKLIVTGDLEKLALHESLRQLFPPQRDGDDVVWDEPQRLHCATSHRLAPSSPPSRPMLALARAMLAAAGIGKTGSPADLVVVVDDVELGNLGQESVVAQHFRAAVNHELGSYEAKTQARYRSLLREKCSFHLLCPMVESYLFSDADALAVAGVPTGHSPRLVHADVEQFQTDDPAWLPICLTENEKRKPRTPWWNHERHPKLYLEHLIARGGENAFYEETTQGKRALMALRWLMVPKSQTHIPIIRSLFEDIADWFKLHGNPLGNGPCHPDLYPSKSVNRANLLLRNM
jgi:hypothetical protein